MRYVLHIEYATTDKVLGEKIADHVQEEYARAWNKLRAHKKTTALEERVTRCEER